MLNADPTAMNSTLRSIVNNRSFWTNVEYLVKILEPAKNAVKCVEYVSTTMADVFLVLIQMAAAIKALPIEESEDLREF